MRDLIAHTLKHFLSGGEMVLRKFLPEESGAFRAIKRAYYDLRFHKNAPPRFSKFGP
jgi:hypothetical protein